MSDPPVDRPDGSGGESAVGVDRSVRRLRLVLVAVLLVTMPAVALVGVYAVVTATQNVAFAELSTLELVELYLLELGVFVAFAFLLYRVTLIGVRRVNADAGPAADATGGGDAADAGLDAVAGTGGPNGRGGDGPERDDDASDLGSSADPGPTRSRS